MGNSASLEPLQQAQTFEQINTWVTQVCVAKDNEIADMKKDEKIKTEEAFKIFLSKKNIIFNQNTTDTPKSGYVVGYFFTWFFHGKNSGILLARLFLENAQDIYSLLLDSINKDPNDCEPILAALHCLLNLLPLNIPSTGLHPLVNLFGFEEFSKALAAKQPRQNSNAAGTIPKIIEEMASKNKAMIVSKLNGEIQRKMNSGPIPHESLIGNTIALQNLKEILIKSKSIFHPVVFGLLRAQDYKIFGEKVEDLTLSQPGAYGSLLDVKSNDDETLRIFLKNVEDCPSIGPGPNDKMTRHTLTQFLVWFFYRQPGQNENRSPQELEMFRSSVFAKNATTGAGLYQAILRTFEASKKENSPKQAGSNVIRILQTMLFDSSNNRQQPQQYYDMAVDFLATSEVVDFLKTAAIHDNFQRKEIIEILEKKMGILEG